jgi:hypothetical protein
MQCAVHSRRLSRPHRSRQWYIPPNASISPSLSLSTHTLGHHPPLWPGLLGAIGLLLHVPHLSVEWVLGWLMAPVGTPHQKPFKLFPPPHPTPSHPRLATLPAHTRTHTLIRGLVGCTRRRCNDVSRVVSVVAWLLGVPWGDCVAVGTLLGKKTGTYAHTSTRLHEPHKLQAAAAAAANHV